MSEKQKANVADYIDFSVKALRCLAPDHECGISNYAELAEISLFVKMTEIAHLHIDMIDDCKRKGSDARVVGKKRTSIFQCALAIADALPFARETPQQRMVPALEAEQDIEIPSPRCTVDHTRVFFFGMILLESQESVLIVWKRNDIQNTRMLADSQQSGAP